MGGVQKHREGWRARLREDLRMNELQASDAPVPKLFPSLSTHAFECLPPPRSIHGLPRPHSIIQTWMKWCTFERRCELAHNHPERQRRPPSSRTCGATCRKVRPSVVHGNAPTSGRHAAYAVAAPAAEQKTSRREAVLNARASEDLLLLLLFSLTWHCHVSQSRLASKANSLWGVYKVARSVRVRAACRLPFPAP